MNRIEELEMRMDLCKHNRRADVCWMCQEEDYHRRYQSLLAGAIWFAFFCFLIFGITASCRGAELNRPSGLGVAGTHLQGPYRESAIRTISGGNGPESVRMIPAIRAATEPVKNRGNVAGRPLGVESAISRRGADFSFLPTALANPPTKKSSGIGVEAVELPRALPSRNSGDRNAKNGTAVTQGREPLTIYAQLNQTPGAQTVEANRPLIRSAPGSISNLVVRIEKPGSISDRFLLALASVESLTRSSALGDSGLARGAFQFHKAAWDDVSALRLLRGTYWYRYTEATNYPVAREYARERCEWLRARLIVEMGRLPTAGEIYAAYNCGLTRFIERGCKLPRCPRSTRDAAKRLEAML